MSQRNSLSFFISPVEIAKAKQIFTAIETKDHVWLRAIIHIDASLAIGDPNKFSTQQLAYLTYKAVHCYDGLAVLLLSYNDFDVAAAFIYETHHKKLNDWHVLTLLRFTPLDVADSLIAALSRSNTIDVDTLIVLANYPVLREKFCAIAPYIARLSKTADLRTLSYAYGNSNFDDIIAGCEKDFLYGNARRNLAGRLLEDLLNHLNLTPPKGSLFYHLRRPSQSGTRRAAYLLQEISAWTHDNQKDVEKKGSFNTIRHGTSIATDMKQRYAWCGPIAKVIAEHSNAPDIIKLGAGGYHLCYRANNGVFAHLTTVSLTKEPCWHHGQRDVCTTWPRIETLLETILALKFNKSANEDDIVHQEKLSEFYQLSAELVWFIGNTTPMYRGSGSYAEIMLALVHHYHHFKPPTLKLDFPQLDVLDITFPLSDYKKFFTYFFEPSTIPKHLRNTGLTFAELTPAEQITQLYQTVVKDCKKSTKSSRVLSVVEVENHATQSISSLECTETLDTDEPTSKRLRR